MPRRKATPVKLTFASEAPISDRIAVDRHNAFDEVPSAAPPKKRQKVPSTEALKGVRHHHSDGVVCISFDYKDHPNTIPATVAVVDGSNEAMAEIMGQDYILINRRQCRGQCHVQNAEKLQCWLEAYASEDVRIVIADERKVLQRVAVPGMPADSSTTALMRKFIRQSTPTALQLSLSLNINATENSVIIEVGMWLHRRKNHAPCKLMAILLQDGALCQSILRPADASVSLQNQQKRGSSIEEQFDSELFLKNIANSSQHYCNQFRECDIDSLADELKQLGLRTTLRPYQLQGVMWMRNVLQQNHEFSTNHTRLRENYSCPTASSNDNDAAKEAWLSWRYGFGGMSVFESSIEPTDRLWYNALTEEYLLTSDDSEKMNCDVAFCGKNLILADEMGIGKSVQILCLVLLLKASPVLAAAQSVPTHRLVSIMRKEFEKLRSLDQSQSLRRKSNVLVKPSCLCGYDLDLPFGQRKIIKRYRQDKQVHVDIVADDKSYGDGWVMCEVCEEWRHTLCAGYPSVAAADASDAFVCLKCSALYYFSHPLPAPTTVLLVVPETLIAQWQGEIVKHLTMQHEGATHALRVFVYKGIDERAMLYDGSHNFDPRNLIQYDIIIMSISTLQRSFHNSNIDFSSARIQSSTYPLYPPPFLGIRFRMVVIDETQNIEASARDNQVLHMACRIAAEHRVCVSGTPFGNDKLSDLYSLCQFLEIQPFAGDDRTWRTLVEIGTAPRYSADPDCTTLIHVPPERRLKWLLDLFAEVTLRRTKHMVADQIDLAESVTITRTLHFTEFEMALYKEKLRPLLESLADDCQQLDLKRAKDKLSIMRKGCCHPQILDKSLALRGSAGSHIMGGTNGPRPLDEIMVIKVENSRTRCEEMQRQTLFHCFTLAGISILQAQCAHMALSLETYNGGAFSADEACSGRPMTLNFDGEDEEQRQDEAVTNDQLYIYFMQRALMLYSMCVKLVQENRKSMRMIAMVKVIGDKYLDPMLATIVPSDENEYILPHVFHLQLRWQVPSSLELNRSPIGTWMEWKPRQRLTVKNFPPCMSTDAIALHQLRTLLNWKENDPSDAADVWFAKLHFSTSKKITSIQICDAIEEEIVQLLKMFSNQPQQERTLLFPADFSVAAVTGTGGDGYVELERCSIPLLCGDRSRSTSSNNENIINCAVPLRNCDVRTKRWVVRVHAVHPIACRLRIQQSTSHNGASVEYAFVSLETDSLEELFNVKMSMKIELSETQFEVDTLQELHMLHNIREVQSLLHKDRGSNELMSSNTAHPLATEASVHELEYLLRTPTVADIKRATIPINEHLLVDERAKHIEQQLLDAATGRRAAAKSYLQQQCKIIEDLETEIQAHIADQLASPTESVSSERMWWIEVLISITESSLATDFYATLQSTVEQGGAAYVRYRSFTGITGLNYLLGLEYDDMKSQRETCFKELKKLPAHPQPAEIVESSDCRRCRQYFQKKGKVCRHCLRQDVLLEYGKILVTFRRHAKRMVTNTAATANSSKKKNSKSQGHLLGSSTGHEDDDDEKSEFILRDYGEDQTDSALLMVMKILSAYAVKCRMGRQVVEICKLEIKRLEALVVEHRVMMQVWERYSELLKAYDELEQSKSRLQLKYETLQTVATSSDENNDATQLQQQLHPFELPSNFNSALHCACINRNELASACRTFNFYSSQAVAITEDAQQEDFTSVFKQLESAISATEKISNGALPIVHANSGLDNECIICRELLFAEQMTSASPSDQAIVVMLPCAHRYHRDCARQWITAHRKCPLCKARASMEQALAVAPPSIVVASPMLQLNPVKYTESRNDMRQRQTMYGLLKVRGRWGTKVDALVLDLLELLSDPSREHEKGIVFSQWSEMIDIVAVALHRNGIRHVCCTNRKKDFNRKGGIEIFRSSPDVRVLVMPLVLGAEGLDLIVASHVFLLEPLLNMQQEAQAVNRINRIGQTLQPTIHKYVIQDTIEERIIAFTDKNKLKNNSSPSSDGKVLLSARAMKRQKTDDGLLRGEDIIFLLAE